MSFWETLFIDTTCPKQYSDLSLIVGGIGGTEATVIRIAENVPSPVTVAQHCRTTEMTSSSGVSYRPLLYGDLKSRWGQIVVLRSPDVAITMRKRFKHTTSFWLWLHDAPTKYLADKAKQLADLNIGIICVSNWQKTQVLELFRAHGVQAYPKIKMIYNPIANELDSDNTAVDPNKLVFFSSPHKGLSETLTMFQKLREFDPALELHIANPGYFPSMDVSTAKNVHNLGELAHEEVIKQVRSALCVFYPNTVFPETFGLVLAEANAVGTPVLTHPIGAVHETLTNPGTQIVDCKNIKTVVDKVLEWKAGGRPEVHANKAFRLENVIREWKRL